MRSRRPATARLALLATAAVLATALAGCSSSGDEAVSSSAGDDSAVAQDAVGPEIAGVAGADTDDGRSIVTTGSLTVVAPDPVATAQQIATMVDTVGGRVESRSQSTGPDDERTAYVRVRLPADATDDTIRALSKAGDVQDVSLDSADVTSTAQDLDARIAALTTSTTRLRDLMADAASTADLLAAEKELTSRQADLESLESQRAQLADQVAMSTLDIAIVPEPPAEAGSGGFTGGMAAGWDALVATVGVAVVVIGVLLPWVVAGALVLGVVLLLRRRSRRAASAAPDDAAPDPAAADVATPARSGS
ncbi:uncharacterized protein DUF4349 [Sediminihabitans luteus]|uniref:Uncharacterized protein DUF4349 n=1 Tax=Sediminihabitans luteus TaxID=1138585 RepID=A0A2M9CYA6_9CELL|nr:DUF4349 domain-containing protein [Sediminihabitans luteus]PJJ76914.1 uncharacterized protein DUF4349 [Sediminihabitans luteus]GII99555.1 hypothetical protein Slu03_19330 [Sediminihabitans luteus]